MSNKSKKNPWCSEHQGKQNKSRARCFAYLYDSKTGCKSQPEPLYAFNGRKIAALWCNVLVKIVKGTKHMLRHPMGWACDSMVVIAAKNMGAEWFHILDKETRNIYECSMEDFLEKGIEINRGYGEQIVLPIQHWKLIRYEEIKEKLEK
jgi:hypothetical protein